MKFSTAVAALAALLPIGVFADFDMWETTVGFAAGQGNGEGNAQIYNLLIAEAYVNVEDAICNAGVMNGIKEGGGSPWCDRGIKFNNGCAVLRNCAGGGEPHIVTSGQKFADLEDCGGGLRGECYAWHDLERHNTCAWQETGRISYSRVACKTSFFNGKDAIGAWV